jgi:hypothetical protein
MFVALDVLTNRKVVTYVFNLYCMQSLWSEGMVAITVKISPRPKKELFFKFLLLL